MKVEWNDSQRYTGADRIVDERRHIDDRCDDLAHLTNAQLGDLVARIAYTFRDSHPNKVTLRLAAARLHGEKPAKRVRQ